MNSGLIESYGKKGGGGLAKPAIASGILQFSVCVVCDLTHVAKVISRYGISFAIKVKLLWYQ